MWQLQDLLFPEECRWTEKEFNKRYTRPITAGIKVTATRSEHALCVQRCSELAAAVEPHVLYARRVEAGALSLLDCPTVAVLVQLSPLQSALYRAVLQLPEPSNLAVCRYYCMALTSLHCVQVLLHGTNIIALCSTSSALCAVAVCAVYCSMSLCCIVYFCI
jgi:hypothetical protein